ncbi:MAG: PLP-dependent aminotransferase family protein [Candidatus Ornithomonoglobus sp.]
MNIDKNSDKPIYMQIYDCIVDEIINGYLMPEERLPSRRGLCRQLGVAERTVENAYHKLLSDGYIVSRPGSGYYVSRERVWDEAHNENKGSVYNFSSNGVETSKLPFAEWSRLLRSTVREDTGLFQHGEKAGEWCLRKSIRRMLFRTQGIKCKTEQIIIGPGAEDLMRELFMLLAADRPVLMNNYYHYRVRSVAEGAMFSPEYITSDADGIDIDELNRYDSGLLFQKPTHDLPTCATLSEEKRRALIEWAEGERYIIEDAGENDYQYGERAKTLWELSGGKNVIYLGSFSKTIAPSMKIGYIIAPEEIVKLWFEKKRFYANRVSRVEQVTLSKFIDFGHYERHLGYMRSIYHEKALALRRAVTSSAMEGHVKISGDEAGMFCLMSFDINLPEAKANKLLLDNGIKLSPISSCIADRSRSRFAENTYITGFGELRISEINDGIAAWEKAWKRWLTETDRK